MRQLLIVLGIIVVILLGVLFFLRFLPTNTATSEGEGEVIGETLQVEIIDVNDIIEDHTVYEGLTLDVEGVLTDWVDKRSFMISKGRANAFGSGGRNLLVIRRDVFRLPDNTPTDSLALGEEGLSVRVVGLVGTFHQTDIETQWGIQLDDDEFRAFENRPVIFADTVQEL